MGSVEGAPQGVESQEAECKISQETYDIISQMGQDFKLRAANMLPEAERVAALREVVELEKRRGNITDADLEGNPISEDDSGDEILQKLFKATLKGAQVKQMCDIADLLPVSERTAAFDRILEAQKDRQGLIEGAREANMAEIQRRKELHTNEATESEPVDLSALEQELRAQHEAVHAESDDHNRKMEDIARRIVGMPENGFQEGVR